jgi:hypothetical protein
MPVAIYGDGNAIVIEPGSLKAAWRALRTAPPNTRPAMRYVRLVDLESLVRYAGIEVRLGPKRGLLGALLGVPAERISRRRDRSQQA